ncbi:tannase and feruloyl esterase [Periconia macrospinosa]|uniref:Carboxylic ester hydrolase n=1 Tax=Periconia macrospinosa TaxID=97972 RepID=A0A2V1E459_9PLEO|nr:tannase and feruloyl esterase [Periconia macrospinosa]
MRFQSLSVILSLVIARVVAYASNSFQDTCADLAHHIDLDYPFVVSIAQHYPPNSGVETAENITCETYQHTPIEVGFCRFNLKIATTNSSEIYVQVWLPEGWKGRLLTTGNGGLGGCIGYPTLAYGVSQGFVSIGANGGHNGTSGGAFYNQPEVIIDNSRRSDLGKSYYVGCSAGGKVGWKIGQTKPDAFDGNIVGAPAFDFYRHITYLGLIYTTLWGAVNAAALQQCDGLDGAYDGIIKDPRACKSDESAVSCNINSTSLCFTDDQIATVKRFFAPITYNDTILHPTGHFHGYETDLFLYPYIDLVLLWLLEIFRYMVYNDINWDRATFTLEDGYNAVKLDVGGFGENSPDITAFRERGDTYYASVQDFFEATTAELDEFYRYFRVGGIGHCYGGPAANVLGQDGANISGLDADDNLITRIVEWAERGEAPEFVRGTKYVDDVIGGEVAFKRKHCKVPLVNSYKGTKKGTDEDGWECVEKE